MVGVPRVKTTVPHLPREFVPRPELLAALDRGDPHALTLVCAPPGYGKTVLLADWARRPGVAAAWVSLDEDDDDPRLLWRAVLAALATCPAMPSSSPLRTLAVPPTTVGVDFFVDLADALASVPTRLPLVLDDAHHLRNPSTLHGIEFLLRDRRSNIRLVLASRVDPALSVARLRLEERLTEVRIDQLTFSIKETEALAELCGLNLTSRQTAQLHARTDGWVAGIRLAALPLAAHPEPDAFLAAFSGDERPVADYLADEVFSRLSEEDGELLRRVSICDPIPSGLATDLCGRADAADVLSAMERSTGLVRATGPHGEAFRIHAMLRSYLAADLLRHGPAQAAQLHRQAALWWDAQRRPAQALHHAARADDLPLVRDLLHWWAADLLARGDHLALSRSLEALGSRSATPDPWMWLVSAHLHFGCGDRATAQAEANRAGAPSVGAEDSDLLHFRTATQRSLGMGGRAHVADGPAPEDPALAALVLVGRGAARLSASPPDGPAPDSATAMLGDLEAALGVARDQHFAMLEIQCLSLIGSAALALGDHGRAASAATAAINAATAGGWYETLWTTQAHAVLAQACVTSGDPVRALQVSEDGLRSPLAERDPLTRFALRCGRGGALFDIGNRPAGLLELQEAHAEVGPLPIPAQWAATAALLEHRAALLLDLRAAAGTAVGRLAARGDVDAELMLMKGWAEAAAGRPQPARAAVTRLLRGQVRPLLPSTVVEAWLVEVWASLCLGERSAARRALQTAVASAEPLDAVRPFSLVGQGIRVLLVDQLGGATDPTAFAYRCLAVRPRTRRPPMPRLSAREQNVLLQLNSLNNLGEIADELDVSVNTVKSHVRAIYSKLGVTTRRTAVLTGLERGLLT
jgi:LuxR family transcriptional regulator, maltose regulon positive regulatory protein